MAFITRGTEQIPTRLARSLRVDSAVMMMMIHAVDDVESFHFCTGREMADDAVVFRRLREPLPHLFRERRENGGVSFGISCLDHESEVDFTRWSTFGCHDWEHWRNIELPHAISLLHFWKAANERIERNEVRIGEMWRSQSFLLLLG